LVSSHVASNVVRQHLVNAAEPQPSRPLFRGLVEVTVSPSVSTMSPQLRANRVKSWRIQLKRG
jgi:hypothetical protein